MSKVDRLAEIARGQGVPKEVVEQGSTNKSLGWNLNKEDRHTAWYPPASLAKAYDNGQADQATVKNKLRSLDQIEQTSSVPTVKGRAKKGIRLIQEVFSEELSNN